ncbi:putative FBD-associated F-box protein At5g53635 [Trifolium pratense]|uniref:putative FBD-associated F-box protein At5g53635 n=1 Tax=Trifolium pratense TaxID=57577 RepID=UPI001E696ECE|nr:putative FBD-associated F-box protein At5g53635 [Trifolium pratense]
MSRLIDIISALPDALLHHILFFLPTKEAAATMTLSKRWKPLLSIINLDDQHFPDPSAFREMFNSFTTNRDKTLPIHSFQLICRGHNHYCIDDIPNFVNAVVQRNVENLSIDLSNSLFPTFVLTTKFLSVLKLKKLLLDDFRSVDLPSLKFLCLESVTFTHHSYLIKILSACPVLEELETKDLTVKKIYGLHRYCPDTYVTWLSKLARANISGRHVFYDCLNNAEHLQLHVVFPYGLHNMFHNLTYIELALDLLPRRGFFKWNWLMKLLPKSPKLQTLIIHEVDIVNNFADKEWVSIPKIVPECLLYHLTTCSIRNYSRINWELPFAKYIMGNSRVLSTMTIQIAKSVKSDTKIQMCKELSLCPRNSATCKLLFI